MIVFHTVSLNLDIYFMNALVSYPYDVRQLSYASVVDTEITKICSLHMHKRIERISSGSTVRPLRMQMKLGIRMREQRYAYCIRYMSASADSFVKVGRFAHP